MITGEILLLFLATTFVVVLSPGPAAIAVSVEGASTGMRRSLLVVLGIAVANSVFFILSATGISALIVGSNVAFSLIKWVGVLYLLYLGYTAIFSRGGAFKIEAHSRPVGPAYRSFMRGFILEMANPKALLYFAALLPQFIDTSSPVLRQFFIFGLLTMLIDFLVYGSYATLGTFSARSGFKPKVVRTINQVAGGMLILSGLKMASLQR